ncbi:hypothetical protein [Gracilibacillus dipsosauri]|uniref:hypothetical protein n=1 Tax=Gracilibacillus dipsosauri TaxID=178340 RepID=UPI002409C404
MLTVGLIQLFIHNGWRWLVVTGTLFGLTFFIDRTGVQKSENIFEFIVTGLTQHYLTLIVIPLLYFLLIVDFIPKIMASNVIYIRARSKVRLLFYFIVVHFAAAFTFSVLCFILFFISGWVQGMHVELSWDSAQFFYEEQNPLTILTSLITLYIVTLTSIGTFTMFISLRYFNSVIALGFGVFICLLSYIVWMIYPIRTMFKFTPIAQMMFFSLYPNKISEQVENFTIDWSIRYNLIVLFISIILMFIHIRKKQF